MSFLHKDRKGVHYIMIIAIWGWYGKRNYGDDYMLLINYKRIKKVFPDAKIRLYGNEKELRKLGDFDVNIYKRTFLNFIKAALVSDVFIWGGGSGLPHKNNLKIVFACFLASLLKIRKKKFIMFGFGVGGTILTNNISKYLFKCLIKKTTLFTCRQQSINKYIDISKYPNIHIVSDLIFSSHIPVVKTDKKYFAFSLANVSKKMSSQFKIDFINQIKKSVIQLKRLGYHVKFISFSQDDDDLNKIIADEIESEFVPYIYSPLQMAATLNDVRFLIAMRFHANLTAFKMGIPNCSISYSEKCSDLFKQFDLDNLSITFGCSVKEYSGIVKNVTSEEIVKRINYVINNEREIQLKIKNTLPYFKEMSEKNYSLLFECLKGENSELAKNNS